MRPTVVSGAGGDVAVLLRHRPPSDPVGWLCCEAVALRRALAATPDVPVVGFVSDDVTVVDVDGLVGSAVAALRRHAVVARLLPVTDAVKLVDGRRVVRTRDRSTLRRVAEPAFVRGDVLRTVLEHAAAPTVTPLPAAAAASGGVVGSFDPRGVGA